jgi:dynein heavy chain
MHAMLSDEKERIPFVKIIDPINKNVEDWMTEVEKMMKCSVRHCFHESILDYPQKKRTEWVAAHPGMCILNGSQTIWT